MISGDKSIENIKMYRPHSMLINETIKIIKARTPIRSNDGEYWVIRKPANRATSRNDMTRINDRTFHLKPFYPAYAFLYFSSICEPVSVTLTERFQVQGSRFKGYSRLRLLAILITVWHTRHTPLGETDL